MYRGSGAALGEMMTTQTRIDRIVSHFVRSEYFANWQAERVSEGGYSRDSDRRDRYDRCQDAAEQGADGSTHRECIEDMRSAFRDYLRYRPRTRNVFREYPYRVESAADAHFDALEHWHIANGSIDQEIG